jgi:asparagine synthase (glutamine-hydrolysing)
MCGIAGFVGREPGAAPDLLALGDELRHRGPDDTGEYQSPDRRVRLAHWRLSIIDLSSAGHQPMTNADSTLWITYNGEIYNYVELDAELKGKGYVYRSHSDTETIVHAYEEWGQDCVGRLNGMFAFALWDARRGELFCARDRFGEKPFYYVDGPAGLAFASEIKLLLRLTGGVRGSNRKALARFLAGGLADVGDETFFEGIHALPAGHVLVVRDGQLSRRRYWQMPAAVVDGRSDESWIEEFRSVLTDAVRLRLRSDVPLGTCLSGGVDSSSVIHLMSGLQDGPVSSFSVLYDEPGFQESTFVRAITSSLDITPHEVRPTGEDLYETLPRIIWHNDEPSGSPGQYSQWHVMRLAAQEGVKVLLNGQGADELLAGYVRYFPSYVRELVRGGRWPAAGREVAAHARLQARSVGSVVKSVAYPLLPRAMRGLYRQAFSAHARGGADFLSPEARADLPAMPEHFDTLADHLAWDLTVLSLPALVHSEDRCSMAFSREIRLPFLDHRLVELVTSMPPEMKIRGGTTKYVLRSAMGREGLAAAVLARHDKKGYPTPAGRWFRTFARDKTWEILTSASFRERGLLDQARVERAFKAHCDGTEDSTTLLWRWVGTELWFRCFLDTSGRREPCTSGM